MKTHAPHVAKAEAYARDVVEGRILACRWVKLACKRHLDDLTRQNSEGFPYWFNPEKAERICAFFEKMPHTKGEWAKPIRGKPNANLFVLQPWQCFILCCLYGWLKQDTELRRFSKALLMIPRKSGKSPMAAVMGLYALAADDEYGAEVYSGATTEKQAWEVFKPARLMALQSEAFRKHFGVTVNAKSLTILSNGSKFEPLIGDPGDGASPSFAVVDEYHEHDSDNFYSTMETGMVGRQQALLLAISTAGANIAGPCYQAQKEGQQVLEGILQNDELFVIIYTIDKDDDWATLEALKKANPNYGVSVREDKVLSELHQAKQAARKQAAYKIKHLNMWVSARNAWMNMEWWNKCADRSLKPEDFKGEPCYLGLDLASKIDVAARAQVFVREMNGDRHLTTYDSV
jgi:phage terminase large subunit-like protein